MISTLMTATDYALTVIELALDTDKLARKATAKTLQTSYLIGIEVERYGKESIQCWQLIGECVPVLVGMLKSDYSQMMKTLSIPVYFVQGFVTAFSKDVESFVASHIPTEEELIEDTLDSMSDAAIEVLTVFIMALMEVLNTTVKLLAVTPTNSKAWRKACQSVGVARWSKLKISECQSALIEAGYGWN